MSRRLKSDRRYTHPYRVGTHVDEMDAPEVLQRLQLFLEGGHVHISFTLTEDRSVRVERSGFPSGPFREVYAGDASGEFVWRDDEVPLNHNTRYIYYRIRLVHGGGEEVYGWDQQWDRYASMNNPDAYGITWGAPGVSTPNAPAVVREIRQRFNVMLQGHAGTRCLVYRPAWDAGACDVCTDPRTGSARRTSGDFCQGCLGTGFQGGYYTPILSDRVPNTSELARMLTPVGHSDIQERGRSLMRYWPRVEPNDVLRDLDGKLWQVTSCYDGDMYGTAAMSMVDLTELSLTHPVNSLKLPDGFLQVSNAPRRALARATNLAAFSRSSTVGTMSKGSPVAPEARGPESGWGDDWGVGGGNERE